MSWKLLQNKNIQGIILGAIDGIVTTVASTFGLSAAQVQNNVILLAGLTVGIANATATSAGYFMSKEAEKEHKISKISKKSIYSITMGCFIALLISSIFVSIPYAFFNLSIARLISILIATVSLAVLGLWHAYFSKENMVKESIKMVTIGLVAALVCFLFGTYIPKLIGF